MLNMLMLVFFQIWATSKLSGNAPAAEQKDHEEAERGAQ